MLPDIARQIRATISEAVSLLMNIMHMLACIAGGLVGWFVATNTPASHTHPLLPAGSAFAGAAIAWLVMYALRKK